MSTALTIFNPVRLVLIAPVSTPHLAADLLAQHLGITAQQALRRLACVSGPLAEGLGQDAAQRLARLLAALGLRVRLEAGADQPVEAERLDVAVQATGAEALPGVAHQVAAVLQRNVAAVRHDLTQPGGVILRRQSMDEIAQLRRGLRRAKGVQIATSCPDQAVHDLFARPAARLTGALMRHLTTIGLTPCLFNGALASGLDRRTLDHVTARFGDQVFGLEQAFQRLDLYLSGASHISPLDLADFLATRSATCTRPDPLAPLRPLRIETGLSHAAARQFQTDYEMFGLHTFARLSSQVTPRENP